MYIQCNAHVYGMVRRIHARTGIRHLVPFVFPFNSLYVHNYAFSTLALSNVHANLYIQLLLVLLHRQGILKAGDRVLKIDHCDVTQVSQLEAVTMLQSSNDTCVLEIEYDVTVHGE